MSKRLWTVLCALVLLFCAVSTSPAKENGIRCFSAATNYKSVIGWCQEQCFKKSGVWRSRADLMPFCQQKKMTQPTVVEPS